MDDGERESQFDLGIGTVIEINRILRLYRRLDTNLNVNTLTEKQSRAIAQHGKYKLAKAFLIRAIPLLDGNTNKGKKESVRQKFRTQFDKIQIAFEPSSGAGGHILGNSNRPVPRSYVAAYVPELDKPIDDFIMDIEEELQDDIKVFMPHKENTDYY